MKIIFYPIFGLCLLLSISTNAQTPPFGGTIFLDPDIITENDPTSFIGLSENGRGLRTMYDRRPNNWVNLNAYLFNATYANDKTIEIQVNPEFGSVEAAKAEAEKYAPVLGRLPAILLKDAETVWIHKGVNPFGGGNNNYLIHTGQAALYERDGILEETLVHEGAHTSLDNPHASSEGWLQAQRDDPTFISTYARDFPNREDIAESYLPYLMIRHRADKITATLKRTIEESIPNRIAYFDAQNFDLGVFGTVTSTDDQSKLEQSIEIFPNPADDELSVSFSLSKKGLVNIQVIGINGELVQSLLGQNLSSGFHQIRIASKSLATGIYFLRLNTPSGMASRKLVISR